MTEKNRLKVYIRIGLIIVSVGVLVCFSLTILYRVVAKQYQVSYADIIIMILLFIISSGFLESLSEISFGEKGFFARFYRVENDIKIINEIAKHVLTEGERKQLERLNSDEKVVNVNYQTFFFHEMIRLCQHNFVQERYVGSTWDMVSKYENKRDIGFDLRKYYFVTKEGSDYLGLLKKLSEKQL